MKKEIFGAKAPEKTCTDEKCPFHGMISVKNELFTGKIVKKDINRSATIEWNRPCYVPKYERYQFKRSRMRVHNPACIEGQLDQTVLVARTRPLSKTKNHVIIKLLSEENRKIEIKETENKNSTMATKTKSKAFKEKLGQSSNSEGMEYESNQM